METLNAAELRIGNWVRDILAERNMYVIGLLKSSDECTLATNQNNRWLRKLKNVHPIPLTEDILLKCGFKYNENSSIGILQIK